MRLPANERFADFASHFPAGADRGEPWKDDVLWRATGYADFSGRWAGATFQRGLYRVVDANTGPKLLGLTAEAFPDFAQRVHPFGFDWMGRALALDVRRVSKSEPLILLLEPGTGQALEIPHSFESFHRQLHELREPALAGSFFDAWSGANRDALPISTSQCVGYEVPLFLGGKDTVENLAVQDLDVYWSLSGQLYRGVRNLPPGAAIKGIVIE